MTRSTAACNCADRSSPVDRVLVKYTNRLTLGNGIFALRNQQSFRFRQVSPETFSHWPALPATTNHEKDQLRNNSLISSGYGRDRVDPERPLLAVRPP